MTMRTMTGRTMSKAVRRRWWWSLWGLLAVSAVGFAVYSSGPPLTGDQEGSPIPLDPAIPPHWLALVVHGLPGCLALMTGPFQFVDRLRVRYPRAHRITGRVYLGSVLVGAIAAFFAATFSLSGFSVQVAFYILSTAWIYTLVRAYQAIRRGEVQLHRIWMIRNYALTFAAVTLRVYLLGGLALREAFPELTFDDIYHAAAWSSFAVNVLVAEYFIIHRTLQPLARRRPQRTANPGITQASRGDALDVEPSRRVN
jgi:uncharacterized membrane protein